MCVKNTGIHKRKKKIQEDWKGRCLEAFTGETSLKIDLEQSRMFIAVKDREGGKEVHIKMAGHRCA